MARLLAQNIQKLMKPMALKQGFAEVQLLSNWRSIIGDQAYPYVGLKSLKNKKLLLEVSDSAWAQEVRYMSSFLAEKVNAYFGYKAVERIQVVQSGFKPKYEAPLPKENKPTERSIYEAEKYTCIVKDPVLKQRLQNFGALLHLDQN